MCNWEGPECQARISNFVVHHTLFQLLLESYNFIACHLATAINKNMQHKEKMVQPILFSRFYFFFSFFFSCSSVIHWMGHGFQCLTYANRHGQLSSDFQVKEFVVMDACLWLPVCTDLLRIITSCHAKHTDTL